MNLRAYQPDTLAGPTDTVLVATPLAVQMPRQLTIHDPLSKFQASMKGIISINLSRFTFFNVHKV